LGQPTFEIVGASQISMSYAAGLQAPFVLWVTGMKRLASSLLPLATLAAAGCEQDLTADHPDAAADAPPLPPGNFTCVDRPWPTAVRDPFPINGSVVEWNMSPLSGASIEVHDVASDQLLGTATSSSGGLEPGKWSIPIPTGGTARKIYRKVSAADHIDSYAYDAFPEFQDFRWGIFLAKQVDIDGLYTAAGLTPDPTKGVLWVEVWDCYPPGTSQISAIAGATIEGPPGTKVLYWDQVGNPAPDATSTISVDFMGQDTVAGGYVLGVEPGMVDAVVKAGPLTYRSWPVEVRANTLTVSPRHP
jgi:hypothetical protein